MNALISRELRQKIDLYRRKGGKTSRRNTAARIERFIEAVGHPPEQIGKRHVYEFYEKQQFAPSTERDYHYAICQLWTMLGRAGEPPPPPSMPERTHA
ncbi:hypothetical protein [Vreelandella venusta]|uniref:Uncharacterized protein n=1 Tax=Vreelandella venusta TaxID=44935 RepID=A0AAP9ZGI1_9GAMM|nr:hypothetical protein [Halomonas venusta]QRL05451.1 hypothetical protein JDS37_19390 [Halomonas venusta]GEK53147.1 hypothetical protein HVE01_38680 [Halomonas venusta]